MSLSGRQLLNNTSVIMLSQVFTWVFSAVLLFLLPRYLGVTSFGALNLAGSLWAVVAILATFGMDAYLTREIAKDTFRLNTLFSQSLMIRLALFAVGSVLLFIYIRTVGYREETMQVIRIVGIATILQNINGGVLLRLCCA